MIDIGEIRSVFPQLTDILPIGGTTGQKDVLSAHRDGSKVCLKIVKAYPGGDDRTDREIQAVARLASDYVPTVHDHGAVALSGEARQYIIEQFIEGDTYREVLSREGAQPLPKVVDLTHTLLLACADFEAENLVHRDIKPENLMRDSTGKYWVLDFGLARHLDMTSLTATSDHFGMGTIGYAPPEQYRNLKVDINSRADLYAVGMVAYESLAGQHPYLSLGLDPLQTIHRMDTTDVPPPAITGDTNSQFGDFLLALLQRFPSRRPQNAAEAINWLEPIRAKLRRP